MKSLLQLPLIKSVHERQLLLPLVVVAAVVAVLLHGALTDQRAAEASDNSFLDLPAPPSLPDLRPQLEKTPLTYLSDYYLQLGEQARNKFVLIGGEKQPGLVVTPGVILTSIRVADESIRAQLQPPIEEEKEPRESGSADDAPPNESEGAHRLVADVFAVNEADAPHTLPLAAVDPDLEVALFAMEQPYMASPFSIVDPSVLPAGSVVLAVTLLPGGSLEITPGYLASPGPETPSEDDESPYVSVVFAKPPAAAAIVDLDGRFLGAAVGSENGVRLLSSNQILRAVDQAREGTPCRAIQVSDLSDAAREVLQLKNGVLVEKVLDEAFVPKPSIHAGDILVQWDGEAIADSEQFYSLYGRNRAALVRYQVLRDQKRVAGTTIIPGADCRPTHQPPHTFRAFGLTLRWEEDAGRDANGDRVGAWKVLGVEAESLASQAGVEAGDRVISLNGKRLPQAGGEQQLRGFETTRQPFVLRLHRGDRVKLVALEPGPE